MDLANQKYLKALKNEKEAGSPKLTLQCLREAIELGSIEAAYALGSFYLHGRHVKRNPERAMKYLTIAAKAMHVPALMDIALGSERGDLLPKDYALAFERYFLAMLMGDTNALYEVGRCFYYGIGTEPNEDIFDIIMDMHDWKRNRH